MMEIGTNNFHNYTTANGLATSECNQKSLSLSPFGEFVFGTTQGFTTFYPEKKGDYATEPLKLTLNDLYIHNKPVTISSEKDAILKSTLDKTHHVTLNNEQNSFSISFSAIEYTLPENINYEVLLEGFDKNGILSRTNLSHIRTCLPRTIRFESELGETTGKKDWKDKSIFARFHPHGYIHT